jgi:hypothetical protein
VLLDELLKDTSQVAVFQAKEEKASTYFDILMVDISSLCQMILIDRLQNRRG